MSETKIRGKEVAQRVKRELKTSKQASKKAHEMQVVIGDLLKDCHDKEGLEFLRPYVSSQGSQKQRTIFESLERSFYGGKTVSEIEKAAQIKYNVAAVNNAESLQDLELLQKEFGKSGNSKEIVDAINKKKADLKFFSEFEKDMHAERLEGLEQTFGKATVNKDGYIFSKPAPTIKGMNGADLFAKYGKDINKIQKSGVCEADKLAELAILKKEKEELAKSLEAKTSEANRLWSENWSLNREVTEKGAKITEQSQEIKRLEKNMAKVSEIGHETIAKNKGLIKQMKRAGILGLVAVLGIGVGMYFIGRSNKKHAVEAEQSKTKEAQIQQTEVVQQLNDANARIEELEQQIEEAQNVAEQVETEQTEVTQSSGSFQTFVRYAKPGDNPWDFCREQLKIELGRTPTRQEVLDAERAYRTEHNIPLEEDNYTAIIPVGTPLYWR